MTLYRREVKYINFSNITRVSVYRIIDNFPINCGNFKDIKYSGEELDNMCYV